ncbi:MAG: DUF2520 domain-containing protein [Bacteroidales bacterium]|nr:DUF2520 domain-containing protein [Bacteroidales bacterium]
MVKYQIVQIGAGNLATHLSKALQRAGHTIVQVVGRTEASTKILANELGSPFTISINNIDRTADLYIVSIPDSAITEILSILPQLNGIVVHTSGSTPAAILQKVSQRYGVFYPFQTFSKARDVSLKGVPFCIEASSAEVKFALSEIASSIGGSPVEMNSEQRRWLHLTGVFACNFVNHMFSISQAIAQDKGLTFEMLKPLINETINKALESGPASSQTGPAIRGDLETIKKHMAMLSNIDEEWMEIYRLLSSSIWNTAQDNE